MLGNRVPKPSRSGEAFASCCFSSRIHHGTTKGTRKLYAAATLRHALPDRFYSSSSPPPLLWASHAAVAAFDATVVVAAAGHAERPGTFIPRPAARFLVAPGEQP